MHTQNDTKSKKIFVAGHRGMVGSALCRTLQSNGYTNLLTRDRAQLDLLDQRMVREFLKETEPDFIFLAAAKVGGILANNDFRADFLYQNLQIAANVIHGAHLAGVQRLMFLGSSCIYPRNSPQPIKEEYLLTGELEPTNEPYAIAKIAGLKMCEAYNSQFGRQYTTVMPTNLFGPGDNFDLQSSHVLPAVIRKVHEAKMRGDRDVVVWGTGSPRREFLHVDDLADACLHIMREEYDGPILNVGTGEDIMIGDLVRLVMKVVDYKGDITFDRSKPDGTPRKLLDISRLRALGWRAKIPLEDGIIQTYQTATWHGK